VTQTSRWDGPDLEDVAGNGRGQMTFHLAATYDEVAAAAFCPRVIDPGWMTGGLDA
jgi:hypothetical protein